MGWGIEKRLRTRFAWALKPELEPFREASVLAAAEPVDDGGAMEYSWVCYWATYTVDIFDIF
jgi:hypothetical protein